MRMMSRGSAGWITLCLHESALQLNECELRAELARWLDVRYLIPAAERGGLRGSHPYSLFAFVPASCGRAAICQLSRSRLVEHLIDTPISDRELKSALGRAGAALAFGLDVKVVAGSFSGVEGTVARCTARAVLVRVALMSGSRSVWVKREEVMVA